MSSQSLFREVNHPDIASAIEHVDSWFLENWTFPDQKSKATFVAAGFSRVTCFYFPKALPERIRSACKLLTILFLIDDQLEYMSLEEGKAYNESLMGFCTGESIPDRNVPVQWMMYDIWEEMRNIDRQLANEVLEPVFVFMRSQTAKERLSVDNLHDYLQYRQNDVGQALLAALMRFSYALEISPIELAFLSEMDKNCGKHISLVNDILSYEKEKRISETEKSEGAILCNAVQILSEQVAISVEAAKNVLWIMVRECEHAHVKLFSNIDSSIPGLSLKEDLRRYVQGLEYQMSGNEYWSKTTHRYREAKAQLNGHPPSP
ncbi:Aristolochene synthase in complex with 12,13 Difluorofarnesyl diphosphate [Periconia macrospinosa]|uniref:Terpene synthase n=1 Tax=Periconia macrospinosa TaxID=97972 RepID=A0A2V1E2H2_9PLEO|nr:Aristolochene synthase in complex with 12,13 Difluorofarnesyl diphosphate [Periconia macrospinosa]